MKTKTRLFIADDHKIVIDALVSQINAQSDEFELVGFAEDGKKTLNRLKELEVDILILDISMPIMDGIEVLDRVNEDYPNLKVLVLTMRDDLKHIQDMLRKGARGYILKNKGAQYVVKALQEIRDGKEYIPDDVAQIAARGLIPNDDAKIRQKKEQILKSIREHEAELLGWLTLDLTAKEIADKMHKSISTIETWKKNLMAKTNSKSAMGLVRFAVENGFQKELE